VYLFSGCCLTMIRTTQSSGLWPPTARKGRKCKSSFDLRPEVESLRPSQKYKKQIPLQERDLIISICLAYSRSIPSLSLLTVLPLPLLLPLFWLFTLVLLLLPWLLLSFTVVLPPLLLFWLLVLPLFWLVLVVVVVL